MIEHPLCGRRSQYPERTNADTSRTCKLHTGYHHGASMTARPIAHDHFIDPLRSSTETSGSVVLRVRTALEVRTGHTIADTFV